MAPTSWSISSSPPARESRASASRKADLMRKLWTFHRRLFVAVIVVAVLGVSSALVLVGSHDGGARAGTPTSGQPLSGTTGSRSGTTQNTRTRTTTAPTQHLAPTSIRQVPQTAIQRQIDAELAQAETPAAIAAAQRSTVAAPGGVDCLSLRSRGGPGRSGHLCHCVHHRALGHELRGAVAGRVAGLGRARRGPQHLARGTGQRRRQGTGALLGRS